MSTKEDWEPHINVVGNDVWYTGHITIIGVNNLIKELEQLITLYFDNDNKKINLFISSDGGIVTAALMLYNYLNLNYKAINIIGTLGLSSCATYMLFTQCDTYIYPHIYVLFHPMTFDIRDTMQPVKAKEGFYNHLLRTVDCIYKTKNFKCKWKTQDVYIFADELIKKNIVSGVWLG